MVCLEQEQCNNMHAVLLKVIYYLLIEVIFLQGEWTYIEPSTWSDEELGVPPDSAGPLKK